jgi:hypothetical protein
MYIHPTLTREEERYVVSESLTCQTKLKNVEVSQSVRWNQRCWMGSEVSNESE